MQKKKIVDFKRDEIVKFESKLGGQPDWLEKPQWALNADTDEPMMFLGQIVLDNDLFGNNEKKIAYIFVTHQPSVDDDDFDPDIIDPDSGCTAVIIQPNSEPLVEVIELENGPSLYDEDDEPYTASLVLENSTDPEFVEEDDFSELTEEEQNSYTETVSGDKIGGVPYFFEGDAYPDEDDSNKLILQLNANNQPFFLNIGGSPCMFVFANEDMTNGKIVIQGS